MWAAISKPCAPCATAWNQATSSARACASPVARFVRAFDWAKSTDAAPVEYVDRDDLASLELVVGALRFIRAVPVPTK